MTAVIGPPPGLGHPQHETLTKETGPIIKEKKNKIDHENGSNVYSRKFLLALSKSPLVKAPDEMPSLSQWYGDWEPYHPRFQHHGQHGPMGSFVKSDKYGRGERGGAGGQGTAGAVEDTNGNNSAEFGTSPGYGPRRGDRFGNRKPEFTSAYPPASEPAGRSADSRRLAQSGKNPFGQVSATGAFRPAGRDLSGYAGQQGPESPGFDRRFGVMGKFGRDRDGPPHSPMDDRARQRVGSSGHDFNLLRDKRRQPGNNAQGGGGLEDEDDEWESVPRSPEADRRNRHHAADSAADWRKGASMPQSAGGRLVGNRIGKEKESGSRKTAFPSWMADDSEPAWMGGDADEHDGKFGGGARDRFDEHEEINVDDVDVSGMDGIQAFKVRMREKERRMRERELGINEDVSSSNANNSGFSSGPPPGLERSEDISSSSMSANDRSQAALFDNFASSAKQRAQAKQQEANQSTTPSQTDSGSNASELPGRTSRFARFFDGKPQATALAAQQKQMEAMKSPMMGSSGAAEQQAHASPQAQHQQAEHNAETNAPPGGSSVSMADLFRSMAVGRQQPQQQTQEQQDGSGSTHSPVVNNQAPPGLRKEHSDADVQGMQKIMALLSGGGSSSANNDAGLQNLSNNREDRQGGHSGHPLPSAPPGLNLNAFGQHAASGPPSASHMYHSESGNMGSPQADRHNKIGLPNESQQGLSPPPAPPPGWRGQQPLYGPPQGFGMDPRMMGGNSRSPAGMHEMPHHPPPPPHATGGMPPPPPGAGFPPFPPGMRPPGPTPLPPHLQQHLMGLPPHVQHQVLAQHFHATQTPPHFLPQAMHMLNARSGPPPNQMPFMGGGGGAGMEGMPAGNEASNHGAAHLMALLGHGGAGGPNKS